MSTAPGPRSSIYQEKGESCVKATRPAKMRLPAGIGRICRRNIIGYTTGKASLANDGAAVNEYEISNTREDSGNEQT